MRNFAHWRPTIGTSGPAPTRPMRPSGNAEARVLGRDDEVAACRPAAARPRGSSRAPRRRPAAARSRTRGGTPRPARGTRGARAAALAARVAGEVAARRERAPAPRSNTHPIVGRRPRRRRAPTGSGRAVPPGRAEIGLRCCGAVEHDLGHAVGLCVSDLVELHRLLPRGASGLARSAPCRRGGASRRRTRSLTRGDAVQSGPCGPGQVGAPARTGNDRGGRRQREARDVEQRGAADARRRDRRARLVNPNRDTVYGRPTAPSLTALGAPIDAVLSLVSAERVRSVSSRRRRPAGCGGVVVAAGGFGELGEDGTRAAGAPGRRRGRRPGDRRAELQRLHERADARVNLFTGGRIRSAAGPVAVGVAERLPAAVGVGGRPAASARVRRRGVVGQRGRVRAARLRRPARRRSRRHASSAS